MVWCEGVGVGDITISPSHNSMGRFVSGNSASMASYVQSRLALGGLGKTAVVMISIGLARDGKSNRMPSVKLNLYSRYRWAMGTRRPTPNALLVTFNPGAA